MGPPSHKIRSEVSCIPGSLSITQYHFRRRPKRGEEGEDDDEDDSSEEDSSEESESSEEESDGVGGAGGGTLLPRPAVPTGPGEPELTRAERRAQKKSLKKPPPGLKNDEDDSEEDELFRNPNIVKNKLKISDGPQELSRKERYENIEYMLTNLWRLFFRMIGKQRRKKKPDSVI